MDAHSNLTSSGLQDWFVDLDSWVCRFEARLNMSRSYPAKRDNAVDLDHNFHTSFLDQRSTQNRHDTTQPSPETALQEIFVNGLFIAQKRKDFKNKADFFSIFKGSEDFTHYDYVLLRLFRENGRRHIFTSIRSKI